MLVLVENVGDVLALAPDRAVERANVLDVQAGCLVQQILHLGAVLAHDVRQIAAGVVDPLAPEVELVGEQLAVQGAERAEGVRGEQHAVGGVKRDHGLRPVDHRRVDEGDGVLAEAAGVALRDLVDLVRVDGEAELL